MMMNNEETMAKNT